MLTKDLVYNKGVTFVDLIVKAVANYQVCNGRMQNAYGHITDLIVFHCFSKEIWILFDSVSTEFWAENLKFLTDKENNRK